MPAKPADHVVVAVSRRGADRIRAGHVWVYRSDIVEAKGVSAGALVTVQELSDKNVRPTRPLPGTNVRHTRPSPDTSARPARLPRTLGTAFYSTASQIALRMISLH